MATLVVLLAACEAEEPLKEDIPELVTKVTLTFSPVGGGAVVIATATDPDGDGIQGITVDGKINLLQNTAYALSLSLINELAEISSPEYDITDEVREEGDEHMFFYSWTAGLFSEPAGDGNIDNRNDPVNYEDEDASGLPVGISTRWTAGLPSNGNFRIILKHQPQLKSATSGAEDGETDLDVEFEIVVN